nr:CIA30 family protein [Petrachloros mirabilis]
MLFGTTPPTPPTVAESILFDFRSLANAPSQFWGSLDDVVMGGVSQSNWQQQSDMAVFSGRVSVQNSGGFASVRTRDFNPPLDLSGYTGLELHLQGDGQRYKFLVRDEDRWDSVAYAISFDSVADQWMTVQLPFAQMIPVQRAKTVRDGRQLHLSQIYSLQLMLSKFEYDGALNPLFSPGEFRLAVQTIRVY